MVLKVNTTYEIVRRYLLLVASLGHDGKIHHILFFQSWSVGLVVVFLTFLPDIGRKHSRIP